MRKLVYLVDSWPEASVEGAAALSETELSGWALQYFTGLPQKQVRRLTQPQKQYCCSIHVMV
jgi:hypothetical protein